jgi:predicted metal-binding membrane protein
MLSPQFSPLIGFRHVARPAYLLAASFVAFVWLAIADMLSAAIFSSQTGSLGPGMALAGGIVLMMKGIPFELWQSLCITDVTPTFSWSAWGKFCGMGVTMTLAMMLPCATPAWLTLRTGGLAATAFGFLCGYGFIWTLFSLVLATVDMTLHLHVGPHLVSTSGVAGVVAAGAVVGAGIFQWTPFKHSARLKIAPRNVAATHGNASIRTSVAAGIRYAGYCVKSNGLLMMTMICLGMMNIVVMPLLLLAMVLEKVVVARNHVSQGIGIALVLAGSMWIYSAGGA